MSMINMCFSCRASFIIDTKGMIRQVTINDVNLYRSVDESLRLLKALQYVEKHGAGETVSFSFYFFLFFCFSFSF